MAQTKSASLQQAEAQLRGYIRRGMAKIALSGGDTQPFETAFSNIAMTYLRDRAPQMTDYLLGTQLLEKNEDNNRAVAAMGFQIGRDMYLAPIFFLQGKVKGYELLYAKSQDIFVPLKENWVNYLISKKPHVLGEGIPKNTRPLGVEYPNLSAYSEIPGKYASDMPAWCRECVPGLANAATSFRSSELLVPQMVKASSAFAGRFLSLIDHYPQVVRPLVECYGPGVIRDALHTVKTANSIASPAFRTPKAVTSGSIFVEKKASDNSGMIQLLTYDGTPHPELPVKIAEELKRTGFAIHDTRPEASKLYSVRQPVKLVSPQESGVYDLLTRPGSFERCAVLLGTIGAKGRQPDALVFRTGGEKAKKTWKRFSASKLHTDGTGDGHRELLKWVESLPKAESLEKGADYVLISPNGEATGVFEVRSTETAKEGEKAYRVYFTPSHRCFRDRKNTILKVVDPYDNDSYGCSCSDGIEPMVVLGRPQGSSMTLLQGTIYCPEGTKVVKLAPRPEWMFDASKVESDKDDPIRPGNLIDVQLSLYKSASEMKIFADDCEVTVNDRRMQPKAALFHLVKDHGLREKTARDAIAEARKQGGARFLIKYASQYELQRTAPSAPAIPEFPVGSDSFFGTGMPTVSNYNYSIPVSGLQTLRPGMMNMAAPPDPQVLHSVMQAAQSGQKEVLDASVFNGLLKSTQDESVVDQFLGPLVKGLDALGRMYFNFLWHHELFENRYGSDKMPEMEDALRNNFDSMGDLVLELKKKSVDPFPGEGMETELEQNAET